MSIEQEVKDAIENAIDGAVANVSGGGGILLSTSFPTNLKENDCLKNSAMYS